tara:strand:+ start:428 stop:628 length:201 start_codon:yes stop_codon:yes gene_type:complete
LFEEELEIDHEIASPIDDVWNDACSIEPAQTKWKYSVLGKLLEILRRFVHSIHGHLELWDFDARTF